MIEPDRRPIDEIEDMAEGVELQVNNETMAEAAVEAGREYVSKMVDAGNRVMQNPYGEPIVEVIVPADVKDEVEDIIDEWDLNPSGHGVMSQPPSFSDDKPEPSKGLVSWQFLIQDDEGEELESCGYDVKKIVSGIEDMGVPFMMTKAPRVACSLPVE